MANGHRRICIDDMRSTHALMQSCWINKRVSHRFALTNKSGANNNDFEYDFAWHVCVNVCVRTYSSLVGRLIDWFTLLIKKGEVINSMRLIRVSERCQRQMRPIRYNKRTADQIIIIHNKEKSKEWKPAEIDTIRHQLYVRFIVSSLSLSRFFPIARRINWWN